MNSKLNKKDIINQTKKMNEQTWSLFDIISTFDKQKVMTYVVNLVNKHKVPLFAFGKQWEIYKVALPYEWWEKYYLIAKKKKDKNDPEYDLRDEFRLQSKVYEEVKHDYVKVPEPYWYQETLNGDQYMVMEFVPGNTLYSLIIKKIIEKNNPNYWNIDSDHAADSALVKTFWVEKAKSIIMWIEKNISLYENISRAKIFSKEESESLKKNIKEFLSLMHDKDLYHRDLWWNSRNIIFGENGLTYILDFGMSKIISKNKDPYIERTNKEIKAYVSDEEIINVIDSYTKK